MISMRVFEADAGIAQRPHDFQPGGDAGDPVEAAAGGYGVAVRTNRNDAKRGIGALEPADQVSRRVDPLWSGRLRQIFWRARRGLRETAR